MTRTLRGDQYTDFIIFRSVLPRMRNISDKICRENQTTQFLLDNFFIQIIRTVLTMTEMQRKSAVKHSILIISYVLNVSVHQNHYQAPVLQTLRK
jgi:hypothetical protein